MERKVTSGRGSEMTVEWAPAERAKDKDNTNTADILTRRQGVCVVIDSLFDRVAHLC